MIKKINKQFSFIAIMLLCSSIMNDNMQAAESDFENIAITSSYPFIKLYQQDIELIEPGQLVPGKPFEVTSIDQRYNTYSIQTNFAPWDKSFYFVMAIKDGSWQQVSEKHDGKVFKDKFLWIVGQNNDDSIQ